MDETQNTGMIRVVVGSAHGQQDTAYAETPEGALYAATVLYREAGTAGGYRTASFYQATDIDDADGPLIRSVDGTALAAAAKAVSA